MQLGESFQLNAFTLDYYDLKIKVFYSHLHQYGTNQAMWWNCSSFQILCDCIVMNSISENVITSHWTVPWVSLPFWYFQNDLANGAKKFGVLPLDLSFQCLSGFFFWRSGVLGFNCVAINDLLHAVLISSLILLYLALTRYFTLQHNWWTSNWHHVSCKH